MMSRLYFMKLKTFRVARQHVSLLEKQYDDLIANADWSNSFSPDYKWREKRLKTIENELNVCQAALTEIMFSLINRAYAEWGKK